MIKNICNDAWAVKVKDRIIIIRIKSNILFILQLQHTLTIAKSLKAAHFVPRLASILNQS